MESNNESNLSGEQMGIKIEMEMETGMENTQQQPQNLQNLPQQPQKPQKQDPQ
jgi:hypothetical protein